MSQVRTAALQPQRSHLLRLLLDHAPSVKFSHVAINYLKQLPAELLKRLVEKEAHILLEGDDEAGKQASAALLVQDAINNMNPLDSPEADDTRGLTKKDSQKMEDCMKLEFDDEMLKYKYKVGRWLNVLCSEVLGCKPCV